MSENPRRPPKRSSAPVTTFLIIVLTGILYLGWGYFSGNLPWLDSDKEGTPKVTWLEKEGREGEKETVQKVEAPTPTETKDHTIPLASGTIEKDLEQPNECLQTAEKILLFFEHLDRQNYIQEYNMKGSSRDHLNGIINKLIANPPVVVRETDDLFAILNNMAHFFRVLGPRDILLIKDILINERKIVEPTMALFYKWSEIEPGCPDQDLNIKLPLAGLYEYSGYFINTLGGQSYLFRRSLFLRLLIRYYSILIIDRADSMDANRYGIDIRYTLDALISELQANGDLVNREEYLEKLFRMQDRYQTQYGTR
jgi:hypothetical protein